MKHNPYIDLTGKQLDSPIYRYLPFARVLDHFKSGKMKIARTDKWDDPFENYIANANFIVGKGTTDRAHHRIAYGSCWTTRMSSDAMWRIYSADKLSVRIATTPRLLAQAMEKAFANKTHSKWYLGVVKYVPQAKVMSQAKKMAKEMLDDSTDRNAAKSFLFKRNAFSHEKEIRLMVFDRDGDSKSGFIEIDVDPFAVINSVLVDSRAPDSIVDVYSKYLKETIGFKGRVSKSTIYRPPERLVVTLDE